MEMGKRDNGQGIVGDTETLTPKEGETDRRVDTYQFASYFPFGNEKEMDEYVKRDLIEYSEIKDKDGDTLYRVMIINKDMCGLRFIQSIAGSGGKQKTMYFHNGSNFDYIELINEMIIGGMKTKNTSNLLKALDNQNENITNIKYKVGEDKYVEVGMEDINHLQTYVDNLIRERVENIKNYFNMEKGRRDGKNIDFYNFLNGIDSETEIEDVYKINKLFGDTCFPFEFDEKVVDMMGETVLTLTLPIDKKRKIKVKGNKQDIRLYVPDVVVGQCSKLKLGPTSIKKMGDELVDQGNDPVYFSKIDKDDYTKYEPYKNIREIKEDGTEYEYGLNDVNVLAKYLKPFVKYGTDGEGSKKDMLAPTASSFAGNQFEKYLSSEQLLIGNKTISEGREELTGTKETVKVDLPLMWKKYESKAPIEAKCGGVGFRIKSFFRRKNGSGGVGGEFKGDYKSLGISKKQLNLTMGGSKSLNVAFGMLFFNKNGIDGRIENNWDDLGRRNENHSVYINNHGVRGGLSKYNKKYLGKRLTKFFKDDINSSYPWQMCQKVNVPIGEPTVGRNKKKRDTKYYLVKITFLRDVKYKNHLPSIYCQDSYDNTPEQEKYPEVFKKGGSIYINSITYGYLKKGTDYDKNAGFEDYKYQGTETMELSDIMGNFIRSYYHKKEDAGNKGLAALKAIYKLIMNSIYGKCLQKTHRGGFIRLFNVDQAIKYEEDTKSQYPMLLGDAITALARAMLVNAVGANYDRFVYCDTDSIVMDNFKLDLPKHKSKLGYGDDELGKIRAKMNGEDLNFMICGKKKYLISDSFKDGVHVFSMTGNGYRPKFKGSTTIGILTGKETGAIMVKGKKNIKGQKMLNEIYIDPSSKWTGDITRDDWDSRINNVIDEFNNINYYIK